MDKVHELLHQQTTETPFFVVGKAFFGKKDISQKDGSYTATLWMTFFNIPFYPIDSYRILNTEHNLLPKVYGIGEYILIRSVGMKFDLSQVVWTFIVVYGGIIGLCYLDLYLFIEYSAEHGYGFLAAVLGVYSALLVWNHKTLNSSPRMEVKQVPKFEKIEVAQPTEVVLEESSFTPPVEVANVSPIENQELVAPKPVKRSLESIIAPAPPQTPAAAPVLKPEPVEELRPAIPLPKVTVTAPIETHFDEPKLELTPRALEENIVVPKPAKKPVSIEKPEFNPIPKPVMALAESKPSAATISEPVSLPGQVKFDPNKIMDWGHGNMDINPSKIVSPHDHMRLADWLSLVIVMALLGQFVAQFYFMLYPNQTGDMAVFQSTFEILYDLYVLSIAGIFLFVFTVRHSPYLAYPLLFLSFAYFFRLELILYKFLTNM